MPLQFCSNTKLSGHVLVVLSYRLSQGKTEEILVTGKHIFPHKYNTSLVPKEPDKYSLIGHKKAKKIVTLFFVKLDKCLSYCSW